LRSIRAAGRADRGRSSPLRTRPLARAREAGRAKATVAREAGHTKALLARDARRLKREAQLQARVARKTLEGALS